MRVGLLWKGESTMSQVTRLPLTLLCACGVVAMVMRLHTVAQETVDRNTGVSIQVCQPSGLTQEVSGSVILALVTNRTGSPIYIDRHLSRVPLKGHSSLWAEVRDAKTRKAVAPRALFKPVQRVWHTDDLLQLNPDLSYGPVVDLNDYFDLQPGREYRVRFRYTSLAPSTVGHIRPWQGGAVSREVIIRTTPTAHPQGHPSCLPTNMTRLGTGRRSPEELRTTASSPTTSETDCLGYRM